METDRPIKEVLQRIAFECQESGATKWQVLKIIKELEEFEGTEQQLRKNASEALEKLNPEAAKTFLSFEKMRVYTSAQKLEPFDRGNIIKSLLKETGISRHVAEKIGSEVEGKIKDLKIEYLNTHIIREMVNVKLLEYGHEPVHSQYARIGMPVYEVKKNLDTRGFDGSEILAEYNWLAEIRAQAREMHFEGMIHICAPQDFSTKIFCAAKFLSGSKEDVALGAQSMDSLCTLPLTLRGFNFASAGAQKITKKKMAQECESIGKTFALTKRRRLSELSLFAESSWQQAAGKKNDAVKLANGLLTQSLESIGFYISVDSKYQLKLIEKNSAPEKMLIASQSRAKTAAFEELLLAGEQTAVMQAVAVNLPKIAELSLGREERFFENIDSVKDATKALCEKKKEALQKRPYFEKWMAEESTNAVCLSGLHAASAAINQDDPGKIAETAIASLQKEGYAVSENIENAAQKRFGVQEQREEIQKILLGMGAKTRKSYGFRYLAATMKEAEGLLGDCPFVELRAAGKQQ